MSYIGNEPPDTGAYGVQSFDGGGTTFTLSKPSTTATVLLFIDGVRQTPVDAYSVSGVTLTTTATTPSGTDNVTVQFLGDVVDFGEPSDDSVSTAKIQDDAVTAAKLANSINTEIAANTAKVTNATHTGDVTGATALTIATDAVDIAMLSATGTADATTFLRGDNAWTAVVGGLTEADTWRITTSFTGDASPLTTNWERDDTDAAGLLGTGMSESSGIFTFPSTGFWYVAGGARFMEAGDSRFCDLGIQVSENAGVGWSEAAISTSGITQSEGGETLCAVFVSKIMDVTNTTNILVRFFTGVSNDATSTLASTAANELYFTFTRLGDT